MRLSVVVIAGIMLTQVVPARCVRLCEHAPARNACEARCMRIVTRHAGQVTPSPQPAKTQAQ